LTVTVAPAGEDVTGIVCVLLRVKVAQFGASRTLVRNRMNKKRFALIVGLPINLLRLIVPRRDYRVNRNFGRVRRGETAVPGGLFSGDGCSKMPIWTLG
jgi:hypothetical protein